MLSDAIHQVLVNYSEDLDTIRIAFIFFTILWWVNELNCFYVAVGELPAPTHPTSFVCIFPLQIQSLQEQVTARDGELKRAVEEMNKAINERDRAVKERDRANEERDKAVQEKDTAKAELKKTKAELIIMQKQVSNLTYTIGWVLIVSTKCEL